MSGVRVAEVKRGRMRSTKGWVTFEALTKKLTPSPSMKVAKVLFQKSRSTEGNYTTPYRWVRIGANRVVAGVNGLRAAKGKRGRMRSTNGLVTFQAWTTKLTQRPSKRKGYTFCTFYLFRTVVSTLSMAHYQCLWWVGTDRRDPGL